MRSLPRIIALVVFLFGFGISGAFAQLPTVGDYQSASSGNWGDLTSWQRFNGTDWLTPTVAQGYPGQNSGTDDVTIQAGHTVTIDVSPANAVGSILVEATGILQYEAANARTMMVSDIIRINSGGTFRSALTGTVTTHQLSIAGSIVNEGTLNFSTNTNTAGVGITFTGDSNGLFDISDATLTNLRASNGLVVNKGTSATSILWFTPGGPFQVLSGNSPTQGFLTITSGTFGINGIEAYNNPLFYATTGSYTIPQAGGFRLDNPNATVVGIYGTLINNGEVIIRQGTYNIGSGTGNELLTNSTGRFEMSGGTLNSSGRFRIDGGDCIITGGTMNLATIGHADMTRAAFYASPSADLSISGNALITFAHPNSRSTSPHDDIEILAGNGAKTITGGTFQLGTAATTNSRAFLVNSEIPVHNLEINNANTTVSLTGDLIINNQLTLNGRLLMNNYSLDIGPPAIAGTLGLNDGMIGIGTGTGQVRKRINGGGSYVFPLGNVSGTNVYMPVSLNFTDGTFAPDATVAVSMVRYKHPENLNTTNFLSRYWTVRTTGITNPVYNFSGRYLNGDIPSAQEAEMTIGIYTTVWEKLHYPDFLNNIISVTGLTGDVDISGINAAAPGVTVTASPTSICSGSSAQLTATATGDGPFTYSWDPAAGLNNPTIYNPLATSITTTPIDIIYTVTVTDAMDESVSRSVTVTVNPLPTATIAGNTSVCRNAPAPNITFTGALGTAPYTFTYRINGGGNQTITSVGNIATIAVPTGTAGPFEYELISVRDASSTLCSQNQTGSATITVYPLPVATADSDSPLCAGQTLTLTASGGTSYSWTGPNGWTSSLQNPSRGNVQTTAAGTYTVTVTDVNGCVATASTPVTVNPAPSVSITASPGNTICSGTEVNFTTSFSNAGLNPSFQWRINEVNVTGATNPTFSSDALANSQRVSVVITADPTHCSATATSNIITMTVNPPLMPTVSILESANDICAGSTVNFTSIVVNGGTAPTYQWQVNEANVAGANNPAFSSGTLINGDRVRVIITSNATCASPSTATSGAVTMRVNPLLTPSVSIVANPSTPICPGTPVTFTATPTNGGSNPTYHWRVNDAPVGSNSFTFTSSTLADGDRVTVRMNSNATCVSPTFANSNEIEMNVNPGTPRIPAAIAGDILVCPASPETYTIETVTNATTYNWTVPQGWNIIGPDNTASITVTTGATGQNGNIAVTATNSCGTSAVRTLAVTVGSASLAPTGITIANNNTCFGTSKTLTVTGGSLGTGAVWEWFTGSCGGTPAGTGASITVNPAAGTSTIYYVRATGTCNTTTCATGTVIVNPAAPIQPGLISGTTPVCPGLPGLVYSIANVADATSYNWTVPTGWSITAGQGTTSITATSGNAGQNGNISVTAANSCETSSARSLAVTVAPGAPATPGMIAGNSDQCVNSTGRVYSVTSVPNTTTYNWTVPSGWTITSGNGTNSITVSTNGSASSGSITVVAGNTCGNSAASVLPVYVVTNVPATPGPISGLTAICPVKSVVYSILPVSGAISYTWTVPNNWTISAGQGTTSITAQVPTNAATGNVTLTANNICGSSPTSILAVSVSNTAWVNAGIDQVVCQGTQSVTLNGSVGGAIKANQTSEWDWVVSVGNIVSPNSLTSVYTIPNNGNTPGVYTVRIRSNVSAVGCALTEDEMTITVLPLPTASLAISGTNPICLGSPSAITFTGTPNTTVTYTVSGVTGSSTINLGAGGTATLTTAALTGNTTYTLTNAAYSTGPTCSRIITGSVDITVNPVATVSAGNAQTICAGQTATMGGAFGGGATAATWSSNGTGTFTNNLPTAVYSPSPADISTGTVTLTYTTIDPDGPCGSVTASMILTINPVATVNAGVDQTICAGNTATMAGAYGGSATSGTWSGGAGSFSNHSPTAVYTPTAADINAGTVTLTYTSNDPAGPCTPVADQVIITIDPLATVNAGADQTICGTSTIPLAGTVGGGATSATWSGGAGSFSNPTSLNAIYTPSTAEISDGSVTLTLTTDDPDGPCGAISDQVQITINPSATVNAGTDQTICEGSNLILGGTVSGAVTSGTWSGGSGTFSPNNTTLNATYSPGVGETGLIILTLTSNDPVGSCEPVTDQITLTIDPRPLVEAGIDQTICSGGTATMNGSFSGSTLSATWSTNGGGTFNDINSPTAVYTPGNSDLFNGTVILTYTTNDPAGSCGPASNFITLTINDAIQITTEPVNTGVCATYPATITVQAVGDNLSYAWYSGVAPGGTPVVDSGNISGAQTATLHFTNSTSVNGGSYYVVINGATGCSPVTSEVVTLNVDQEISITTPFDSDEVCVGEDVTFTIEAEPGGLLTYQWRKNGVNIENETDNSLTLTDVNLANAGEYDVVMEGLAGYTCSSAQSAMATLTITPDVTIPVFELGATSTRCQEASTLLYSATANHSTGITYTLDAASITGGNTIDEATGAVTFAANWSGAATITASAEGCNGPATITHVVTITPTVSIAAFSPTTSTRCQGAGTVTTTTTATNSTRINYSLDAASLAGGNTIDAATGAVTYIAGWSGTTTITASAAGCNGPATTTHGVTITPTVTIAPFSPTTSTRCQGAGTVTTTTAATNSTGITYSLDAVSFAGGNTIDAATGAVTYAAGWVGTTTITASAAGCNGPATTTHVVTVNPTVTINSFSPATSIRCVGAGTVTYSTTATNTTGITYSLDATTASYLGNSINASTGAVTYAAGWSGTTTITASAEGCNGPVTASHIVTVDPPSVGGAISPALSTVCTTTNNGTLNLGGNNGTILRWESSVNAGVTWTQIANTSTTHNFTDLPLTTIFRAVVKNGDCPEVFSALARVMVIPLITPTITTITNDLCAGGSTTLTANTGGIIQTIEAFAGGSFNNANPTGWRITENGTFIGFPANANNTNVGPWSETNGPKLFNGVTYNNLDGKFAVVNGAINSTMETPVFNLFGLPSAALSFSQAYNLLPGTTARVELSTDGGNTYNINLVTYTGSLYGGNPNVVNPVDIDMSNYIGMTNLRIRFNYISTTGSSWAVEGITIPSQNSDVTYTWSPAGSLTPPTGSPVVATPGETTTYTLTMTISGCPSTATSVVINVADIPIVQTTNACIGGGTVTFTQTEGTLGGTWTVSGGGDIDPGTGEFTPLVPGCYTATYSTGAAICSDTKSFVVFPAAPIPVVNPKCNEPIVMIPPEAIPGFLLQYSFDDGLTWEAIAPPTEDRCEGYRIRSRYIRTESCDTIPGGITSDIIGCVVSDAVTRVVDLTAPEITCPLTANGVADPDDCYSTTVVLGTPTATDICSPTAGITFTNDAPAQFPLGVTTVTWTATDACGNQSTCSQAVIVERMAIPPPVIHCPVNPTPVTALAGTCFAPVIVDPPVEVDSCETVTYTFLNDYNDTDDASDSYPIGNTTVIWTITDNYENTITCEQTVTVNDLPLECPEDIIEAADLGQTYASDVIVPLPTYSTGCEGLTLTWTMLLPNGSTTASPLTGINVVPSPGTFNLGITTVTYTLIHANGIPESCSFTITVTAKPDITCAQDISHDVDADECDYTVNPGVPILVTGQQPITWTYTLGGEPTGTFVGSVSDPGPPEIGEYDFPVGITTITWTATNEAGSDECTQTVTVNDNQPPTFTVPDPLDECVESLTSAVYNPATIDILPVRPDYYLFEAGSPLLNIAGLADNCCAVGSMTIHWRIDFSGGGSVSGTGQPSTYGSDIQLPGDLPPYDDNLLHQISYWIVDCNNITSPVQTQNITIRPRPNLIKTTMGNP